MSVNAAVRVPIGRDHIDGDLCVPADAKGIIVFVHGSGSSRYSPRNRQVAAYLQQRGFATLLIDLLTAVEEDADEYTGQYRFDIALLADRVVHIVNWLQQRADTAPLAIGLFGASTGGGAALVAAARLQTIAAVVSRGGRPDLADQALRSVTAPTLLIVGSLDRPVIAMNRAAMSQMTASVSLEIVPGASHLFEEPGTLDRVASLTADWFARHLKPTVDVSAHSVRR